MMKKTYEKPVLMTEPFDVKDVITVSDPLEEKTSDWEIPDISLPIPGVHFH